MPLEIPSGLTLYFARHGQTQANLEKRFSGKKDTPLTSVGREQAAEIGSVLKRELGIRPTIACVASPLQRARTTSYRRKVTPSIRASRRSTWDGGTN
jgi:probable phosphoglycerate mutase